MFLLKNNRNYLTWSLLIKSLETTPSKPYFKVHVSRRTMTIFPLNLLLFSFFVWQTAYWTKLKLNQVLKALDINLCLIVSVEGNHSLRDPVFSICKAQRIYYPKSPQGLLSEPRCKNWDLLIWLFCFLKFNL